MRSLFASALAAAALLAGLSATAAHEGHDHGPAAPAARADAAPRGEATSDAFELVAVAQGETLVFYLDRFGSNEPVRDATLAVEAPGGPVMAEAAGGAYRIKAPWLAKPGHTDLIVTVTAGDTADILPLSIDVPDRAAMQASGGRAGRVRDPAAVHRAGRRFRSAARRRPDGVSRPQARGRGGHPRGRAADRQRSCRPRRI